MVTDPAGGQPSGMGLFSRKKKPERDMRPCPRCTQLVELQADECPMCGWDLREAYHPTTTGST
jgi:hypothetical protein